MSTTNHLYLFCTFKLITNTKFQLHGLSCLAEINFFVFSLQIQTANETFSNAFLDIFPSVLWLESFHEVSRSFGNNCVSVYARCVSIIVENIIPLYIIILNPSNLNSSGILVFHLFYSPISLLQLTGITE